MTRQKTALQPAATRPIRRRALLVGINEYLNAPLRGCVNDALMMGGLLIDHFGFRTGADMRLLVDQRATKRGILDRLHWLVDGARAGDVLVFHYSGHGAQVPDRSGDELDMMDECLCPVDFDWDDPLLDEELDNIINTVPPEVNLTVILDCCHSGTGTKAFGTNLPMTMKRLLPPPDIQFRRVGRVTVDKALDNRSVTMTSFRDLELTRFGHSVEEHSGILIAGCRDNQLSNDAMIAGDYHGALTYSLFQALQDHGPEQSYATWVQEGAALIPGYGVSNQDPQLECPAEMAGWKLFSTTAARAPVFRAAAPLQDRHVVYVHGICEHLPGYSNAWWEALKPHASGIPDDHRHEVLWSDLVTARTRGLDDDTERGTLKKILQDTLEDRAQRQLVEATLQTAGEDEAISAAAPRAILGIPGLDCVDDFIKYLLDDDIRTAVIKRFHDIVGPLLDSGKRVEVISHSWGTVVAYEALRQWDDEDDSLPPGRVHNLFTAGSALSMSPVRRMLMPSAEDGRRPRVVENWVNLDARFDIVGGSLRSDGFAVDREYLGLAPVGCSRIFPQPACAHGSYFRAENRTVNRDIFARHINR